MTQPKPGPSTGAVRLRELREEDLPVFFVQELDPDAIFMAAFTAKDPADRAAFDAHMAKIMADPSVVKRTILYQEQIAGNVMSFIMFGEREVCYWLGREFWGKGIATQALALLLEEVQERPLFARAARDNQASIRVLQKCGFTLTGYERGFANARGEEIEEAVLKLNP